MESLVKIKNSNSFVVIFTYFETKEQLNLQRVCKKFNDKIIPKAMIRIRKYPKVKKLQLILNLIANLNEYQTKMVFSHIIWDMDQAFSTN